MTSFSSLRCAALSALMLLASCSHAVTPRKVTGDPLDLLAANKVNDQFGLNGIRSDPSLGKILFANPNADFTIPLDEDIQSITVGYGIVGTAVVASPPCQGVEFRMIAKGSSVQDAVLWSRKLNPLSVAADSGEQHATASIPKGTDSLVLETLPMQNAVSCWAYWNDVKVQRRAGS